MKIHYPLMLSLMATILLAISQCKAPVAQQDTVVNSAADTIVKNDTDKIVVTPGADTVAVATRQPLTLLISNLASPTAPVIVGIYGTDNKFPDPKGQLKEYKFMPDSIAMVATITDLPFGTYALAIYQDVNSNGKIDKNIIGIPTEPYAFSNNYKPTVKAPGFKNCQFEYCKENNAVAMKMIK